jgi:hypothetical protein
MDAGRTSAFVNDVLDNVSATAICAAVEPAVKLLVPGPGAAIRALQVAAALADALGRLEHGPSARLQIPATSLNDRYALTITVTLGEPRPTASGLVVAGRGWPHTAVLTAVAVPSVLAEPDAVLLVQAAGETFLASGNAGVDMRTLIRRATDRLDSPQAADLSWQLLIATYVDRRHQCDQMACTFRGQSPYLVMDLGRTADRLSQASADSAAGSSRTLGIDDTVVADQMSVSRPTTKVRCDSFTSRGPFA